MQRRFYVGGLAAVALLATLGSIALFLGWFRVGAGVCGLALAGIPVTIHLQTREFVRNLRISEGRSGKLSKPGGDSGLKVDMGPIVAMQKDIQALASQIQADPVGRLAKYANEVRRESRMLRLVSSQLTTELQETRDIR